MKYTLDDFIESLSLGELSNLSLGVNGQTGLSPARRKRVISYMNQGLKALSSRFVLVQKELVIQSAAHISLYYLRSAHSVSTGTHTNKYILDCPGDPFMGDVVKVLSVWNEQGDELPLNDENNHGSVATPTYDCIQLPHPDDGQMFNVLYQGLPDILEDTEHGNKEFHLPPYLEEALLVYVASKTFSHMGGNENIQFGKDKMTRFDEICAEVETNDLVGSSESVTTDKLENRGFI